MSAEPLAIEPDPDDDETPYLAKPDDELFAVCWVPFLDPDVDMYPALEAGRGDVMYRKVGNVVKTSAGIGGACLLMHPSLWAPSMGRHLRALADELERRPPGKPFPMSPVRCHGPHRDPRRRSEACASFLGHVAGRLVFIGTSEGPAPSAADGTVWLRCPRKSCGLWNRFRVRPMDE